MDYYLIKFETSEVPIKREESDKKGIDPIPGNVRWPVISLSEFEEWLPVNAIEINRKKECRVFYDGYNPVSRESWNDMNHFRPNDFRNLIIFLKPDLTKNQVNELNNIISKIV